MHWLITKLYSQNKLQDDFVNKSFINLFVFADLFKNENVVFKIILLRHLPLLPVSCLFKNSLCRNLYSY